MSSNKSVQSSCARPAAKRCSKRTFSQAETRLLVREVGNNYETLYGSAVPKSTYKQRNIIWQNILFKINDLNVDVNTKMHLQHKYHDLRAEVKNKLDRIGQYATEPGEERPERVILTPVEQEVAKHLTKISICGLKRFARRIPGSDQQEESNADLLLLPQAFPGPSCEDIDFVTKGIDEIMSKASDTPSILNLEEGNNDLPTVPKEPEEEQISSVLCDEGFSEGDTAANDHISNSVFCPNSGSLSFFSDQPSPGATSAVSSTPPLPNAIQVTGTHQRHKPTWRQHQRLLYEIELSRHNSYERLMKDQSMILTTFSGAVSEKSQSIRNIVSQSDGHLRSLHKCMLETQQEIQTHLASLNLQDMHLGEGYPRPRGGRRRSNAHL